MLCREMSERGCPRSLERARLGGSDALDQGCTANLSSYISRDTYHSHLSDYGTPCLLPADVKLSCSSVRSQPSFSEHRRHASARPRKEGLVSIRVDVFGFFHGRGFLSDPLSSLSLATSPTFLTCSSTCRYLSEFTNWAAHSHGGFPCSRKASVANIHASAELGNDA